MMCFYLSRVEKRHEVRVTFKVKKINYSYISSKSWGSLQKQKKQKIYVDYIHESRRHDIAMNYLWILFWRSTFSDARKLKVSKINSTKVCWLSEHDFSQYLKN